jgi:hypothetical protein
MAQNFRLLPEQLTGYLYFSTFLGLKIFFGGDIFLLTNY